MNKVTFAVPNKNVINPATSRIKPRFLEAALRWHNFGFKVIPIVPGSKKPALKHEPWLTELSSQTIKDYWSKHLGHEIACIVGDNIVVFDTDTPESLKALKDIEAFHNVKPNLVSKTQKGEHHFFRIFSDTYVKSDSHCSDEHPERIDIKTGKGQIVLPPSTGKTILVNEANSVEDLVTVGQVFIDSVYLANGREAPRPPEARTSLHVDTVNHGTITRLLAHINPDIGYEDWLHCIMAVHHETDGSDEGLDIVDAWSSKGQKYKGCKDIETKWRSFKPDVATPYTIGTLIKMARAAGADVDAIMNNGDDEFEDCDYEVVNPIVEATAKPKDVKNPLAQYYLRDIAELEKNAVEQVLILGANGK